MENTIAQLCKNYRPRVPSVCIRDVLSGRTLGELPESARVAVSALDADSVVTVPFRYHHDAVGRLYVKGRARAFDASVALSATVKRPPVSLARSSGSEPTLPARPKP